MAALRASATLICLLLARRAIAEEPLPPPPLPPSVEEAAPAPSTPTPAEPAWIVPAPAVPPRPAPPPAPRKPRQRRILISDFRTGENVPADLGRTLSAVAAREASQLEGWEVVTKADLVARLGAEHGRQMLGCAEDGSCLAELAGALDAERSLGGTVAAAGDGTLLTLTLVDMRQVTTIRSRSETLRALKADDLVDLTRRLAYEVISGKPFDLTGILDIDVAERDTNIFVDQEEVGAGPYREALRIAPGQHRVAVLLGEKVIFSTEVRVEPAGRTTVRPNLSPSWMDVAKPVATVPKGGPYYYGHPYITMPNVRALSQKNGDCPRTGAGLGLNAGEDGGCKGGGAGLRLGVAVNWIGFETWGEIHSDGWLSSTQGYYARMDRALVGVATVVRLPWAFGLRAGVGAGKARWESWTGTAATAGGTPYFKADQWRWDGSLDVVLAPRWGPVRFELSVAALGFGSGVPSKLLPAGVSAPYIFKYQPVQLGIGVIFPREPSAERPPARKYRSPPPPAPPPPAYEPYRPPGM